jgi:rSAM/selenodomain-associated transferase 1
MVATIGTQSALLTALVSRHLADNDQKALRVRGDTLILFVRAPRLGTVKRRLAAEIGQLAALRFHRAQLSRLIRELGHDRRWRTEIVATPDRPRWPLPLASRPQGPGDLGARMQRALARHRRAVLIGGDIPGVRPADIAAAFRALGHARAVFGPAEDGGYWLVGLGRRRPASPFAAVRWSTPHALADTLANCVPHPVALVRRLRDVDTAADYRAWQGDTAC